MRRLALLALLLAGCQSFGAFSEPVPLPAHAARVGASLQYDAFHATDERVKGLDVAVTGQLGLTDATELDLLLSVSDLDLRLKHAFVKTDHVAAAGIVGAGFFTAYASNTPVVYVPAQLVLGLRAAPDVVLFAGPSAWAALGLSSETLGAGFNRGGTGLLGGGVVGVGLDSPTFSFCPQITVMTPLVAGAQGAVTQVSFGFGTQVR